MDRNEILIKYINEHEEIEKILDAVNDTPANTDWINFR